MPRSQTCISGITDLIELARLKDPDFNASAFLRKALEFFVFGDEQYFSRQEAFEMAARDYLKTRLQEIDRQRWINSEISRQIEERKELELSKQIEEQRVQEEKDRAERIVTAALDAVFSKNIGWWKDRLPEHDTFGDYFDSWVRASEKISEKTGVTILPSECYAFVKRHAPHDTEV